MGIGRHYFVPLVGVLLMSLSSGAYAIEFKQVLTDKSTLSFDYKQMNVPLEGNFRQFEAHIAFDPAKPSVAQVQLEIVLASIDAGSSEANEALVGKPWFNAKTYPNAQFVSTSVKALVDNRFEARGKLTIKGKTLDVLVPFTFKSEGISGIFDGVFVLKRLDYAIGEGAWADVDAVANEVPIRFHLVAVAVPIKKQFHPIHR